MENSTPNEPNPALKLKELQPKTSNVVTGDGCERCCNSSATRTWLYVFQNIGDMIYEFNRAQIEPYEAFTFRGFVAPPASNSQVKILTPEEFRIGIEKQKSSQRAPVPSTPGMKSGIPLTLGFSLAISEIVGNAAWQRGFSTGLEIARSVLTQTQERLQNKIGLDTRVKLDDPCKDCCRKRLLSQTNPRRFVTDKHRERVK